MVKSKNIILYFLLLSGPLFADVYLSLENVGNNIGHVRFSSDVDIGGFQFNPDGATVLSAGGGDSEANGFTVSASETTVLGFSLTGSSIPPGS